MKNDPDNYTLFNPYPFGESHSGIWRLRARRSHWPEQVNELLRQARTDLHVARGFSKIHAGASYENVGYWSDQAATKSLRAILWLINGHKPGKNSAEAYNDLVVQANFDLRGYGDQRWSESCECAEDALTRLKHAEVLLQLGYAQLASTHSPM